MSLTSRLSAVIFTAAVSATGVAEAQIGPNVPSVDKTAQTRADLAALFATQPKPPQEKDGVVQCFASKRSQEAGAYDKALPFTKQFFSRVECHDKDEAFKILDAAPKANFLTASNAVRRCVIQRGFPDGMPERLHFLRDRTMVATVGTMAFSMEDYSNINGAVTHACASESAPKVNPAIAPR